MKLAKKKRIRSKQIGRNKRLFAAMTDEQIEAAFKKLAATVRFYWAKRGILFNTNR